MKILNPSDTMKRGLQAVIVSIAFSVSAFCAVVLRFYCRAGLLKRTGLDDYLVLASLVFSIGLTVCISLQQQHGLGQHFDELRDGDYEWMSKYFWISVPLYYLGLTTVKSSVIVQLLKFLVHTRLRLLCWSILCLICTYGFAVVLCSVLACQPVAYFWDRKIVGGRCINLLAFWYCNAVFNIVTDFTVVVIPLSTLHSLQLPPRQKHGLLLVFALGGFGCITSILRLHSIYIIAKSSDVTWDNVGAATWSAVELNTGIICACLPTLMPVINSVCPRLFNTYDRSRSHGLARIHVSQNVQQSYEDLGSAGPRGGGKPHSWYRWEITSANPASV